MSRYVFAKECAIRIDKQQKERCNNVVIDNDVISLSHVNFSYGSKSILRDVSLTIPEKTTVAIVGPSGSGKTTLCNLMARFWDVQSGSVRLDGRDVREYSYDSLIRNFSFVFQRVYLFSDTIANNIRFGKPDASMEEVKAAAKKHAAMTLSWRCRRALIPSSVRAARRFPAASGSASPSPGPS